MDTPVALIIFNRPKKAARVFDQIALAKPRKLFVIADGPRPDRPEDVDLCKATRSVIDRVDWDCKVYKNYSDVNLGSGKRPATGITWVFENVENAIILEDDCEPHPTFFPYCEELLEKYRDDERVMHISGRSVFPDRKTTAYSYYFTRSMSGWGWATWARAWKYHDFYLDSWPELRDTLWLLDTLGDHRADRFFRGLFDRLYTITKKGYGGWDHQWNFAVWAQNGLGIRPYANLVYYMGVEEGAGKFWFRREQVDFPSSAIEFPLRHPPFMVRDREADQYTFDSMFSDLRKSVWYQNVGYPIHLKIYRRLSEYFPLTIRNRLRRFDEWLGTRS